MSLSKGIIYTSSFVFVAPIHKGKYQSRIGLGIDDCAFCKKKDHSKSQCLKLLRENKIFLKSP